MCIALNTGRSHDWVLDTLTLPQVFLYWDNLSMLHGFGKPRKRGRGGVATPDTAFDWVWNRGKGEYELFRDEERDRYEWNAEKRQYEVDGR